MLLDPVVLRLLESRAHRLLPGGLVEITYTGPLSGRKIVLPVQSAVDGDRLLVVAGRPERKRWWRSFRDPRPGRLLRNGVWHDVVGVVLTGAERQAALDAYLPAHPGSRPGVGPNTPVVAFTRGR